MANAAEVLAQFSNFSTQASPTPGQPTPQDLQQEAFNAGAAKRLGIPYQPRVVDDNPLSSMINEAIGRNRFNNSDTAYRNPTQKVTDAVKSLGVGVINSVGSLGALELGLVNAPAGNWASEVIADATKRIQDSQSGGLGAHQRVTGTLNQLSTEQNQALYDKEAPGDSSTLPILKKIGRNFLDNAKNAASDSSTLQDGIAQGIGSLATGGPLIRGAEVLGGKAIMGLLRNGVISRAAALKAAQVGSKLAAPAVIGAQEAAGTYTQTVQQVQGMSHDDLMANSPEYADLIKQGADPEAAREQIANSAGLLAASTQFPVAAAAGTIIPEFHRNPFAKVPGTGLAGTMLREGVEEGLQSGTSQLASNLGVRQYANENQDLLDQVGEQAGQGALFGLGSAGAAQAPHVFNAAAIASGGVIVDGAKAAGKAAIGAVNARAGNIQSNRQAASPVSAENLSAAANETVAQAPMVQAQVEQALADNKVPEAEANQIRGHLDRLNSSIAFDPAELDNTNLSPEVRDKIALATNRIDALHQAAQIATDKNANPDHRLEAATWINDVANQLGPQIENNLGAAVTVLPDDHPALAQLRQHENLFYDGVFENPAVNAARLEAVKRAQALKEADISEEALQTPRGQQAVQTLASVAQSNPEAVSPDLAKLVLEHARNGKVALSDLAQKALYFGMSIKEIAKANEAERNKLDLTPQDLVTHEILHKENGEDVAEKSASSHFKGIMDALSVGNKALAAERLRDMMKFAQHMQNKVEALKQSMAAGNASKDNLTPFQALNSQTRKVYKSPGVWLDPTHKGSVKLAQDTALNAKALGNMANRLASGNPELGVEPIKLAEMDPRIMAAPAKEVMKRFIREAKATARSEATKTEKPVEPALETPIAPPQSEATSGSTETTTAPETKPQAPEPKAEVQPAQEQAKAEPKPVASTAETSKADAPVTEKPTETKTNVQQDVGQESPAPAKTETESASDTQGVTETGTKEAVAPKTLAEAFPNLVGSEDGPVKNWFHKAFKLAKSGSNILTESNPVKFVTDALKSDTGLPGQLSDSYARYLKYAGMVVDTMNQRLKAQLAKTIDKHGMTFAEALTKGVPGDSQVNGWFQNKALNIVENVDGKLAYNPTLQQAAALAGLQWLVSTSARSSNRDAEAVAKILGIDEGLVDEDMVRWFNDGVWKDDAKRSLANKITQFWGVSPDRSAPEGYTKGVPESLSAEVLQSLEDAKLIKLETTKIDGKTYSRFVLNTSEKAQELFKSLQASPDAIERLVRPEPEVTRHIGKPPVNVATNQLHGSPVQLQPQQREAITNAQKTAYRLSRPMLQFLSMLGNKGLLLNLFGAGDPNTEGLNINHAKAIDGFNRTMAGAWENIQGLVAEMSLKAEADGSDTHDMPVYFEHGITSVGRLQMIGAHNPQASKLTREVLLPTWSKLDLSDRQGQHYRNFMVAIAQHLGVKVHKLSPDTSVEEATNLLSGKLAPAVEILHGWVANENGTNPLDLEVSDLDHLKQLLGNKLSPGAIHALVEYARFLEATPEERKAFETPLYLEADGVTDGPINAMMNLTGGQFTPEWVDRMNRGGLFTGSNPTSLADYAQKNSSDLYQLATDRLRAHVADLTKSISDPKVAAVHEALKRVMAKLLDDAQFDEDGKLKFERGIAKNPLTVTVYGSGTRGIASKITKAMVDGLYEAMSNGEIDTQLMQDLELLTTQQVRQFEGKLYTKNLRGETNQNTGRGVNYTMQPAMIENLSANVHQLFARPLRASIENLMAPALANADLVRQATQVQAIHLKYAFKQAIADELANREGGADGVLARDFLSQNELQQIFDGLIKTHPMINTGSQLIFVGGSAQADVETSAFGADFAERIKSDGYVYGPENPGVSGIPYLVIATGDGQMILNAMTGEQALEGVLPVFDGINLPLDKAQDFSGRINQAVHQGWMENPVKAVADAFGKFVLSTGANKAFEMIDEMRLDLSEALNGKGSDLLEASDLAEMVAGLHDRITNSADEIAARKAALAQANLSVDHMASAAAPFTVSDKTEISSDPVEAATRLNELLDKSGTRHNAPARELPEQLTNLGTVDEHGVRTITRDELRQVADRLDVPAQQRALIRDAANALTTKGWSILLGSAEQLQAHTRESGQTIPDLTDRQGVALPGIQQIYLTSTDPETLAHELVHAATIERVYDYFANQNRASGSKVETAITDAMGRIEKLMAEFEAISPADIKDADALTEFLNALAAMEQASNHPDQVLGQAARVNEFMAWVLSNQKLADLARQTKVKNPLALIIGKALEAIKKLIWRRGLAPSVGDDIYSNLRFNTLAIMQAKLPVLGNAEDLSRLAQFHARGYGQDERLSKLEGKFIDRLHGVLERASQRRTPVEADAARVKADDAHNAMHVIAEQVLKAAQASGFNLTQQEASLFKTLVTTFGIDHGLDPNAQARVQDLYRHVLDNLKAEDLMAEPASTDPADLYYANQKLNFINGNTFTGNDSAGRSTMLPAFLALANVHDGFREVIEKLGLPKGERTGGGSLDNHIDDLASGVLDRMSRVLAGDHKAKTMLHAIDDLTARLAESQEERETWINQYATPVGNGLDKVNDVLVGGMQDLTGKAADKLQDIADNTDNKLVEIVARTGQLISSALNDERADNAGESITSTLNKLSVWTPVRELWNEVTGRTKANAPIYDLIKATRAFTQQKRQAFREELPKKVAAQFSRALSEQEWTALYHGMAKTDLAALSSLGSSRVLTLLRDASHVTREIGKHEAQIAKLDPKRAALIQQKAQELAEYMSSGKASKNLLRNADAIARLLNEVPKLEADQRKKPDRQLVQAIDRLTSLYALEKLPVQTRLDMAELAAKEADGMSFVFNYLVGQHRGEFEKGVSTVGQLNRYKGHVPTETTSGSDLRVADDKDYADLVARGYTRVASYVGSKAEGGRGSKGYYFAPLTARSPFNQGIAQNVHRTFWGVDPVTGRSLDMNQAGRITDAAEVRKITVRLRSMQANPAVEQLLPVFDADGDVVAYERSVDPVQKGRLQQQTDLSKVLGIWRGRQAEEASADQFNQVLVERLHDIWNERDDTRSDEFVDLLDPKNHKDPIIADAVSLFTPQMHKLIKDTFGGEGFMVRKDMVNDTIGYRTASVGDSWTGVSRLDPRTQSMAVNIATAVFGKDAYRRLVTSERLIQNVVADAKSTIVVRSIIVPMANMISNIYQLSSRGVPLVNIARSLPKKVAEIRIYHQNQLRQIDLEADLRAARNNLPRTRAIKAEMTSISDANKRLSIWPLIQAGEFSAISTERVDRQESSLFEGKLNGYLEHLVSQLPEAVKTAGRYAIISKDTALFKGLQKSVDYGDMLAKAILYDDLTKRQGVDRKAALATITEEYINYDRLPGRFRGYLSGIGMTWFWDYKLKSIKVALSTLRRNPLHMLLAGMAPTPSGFGTVGLPIKDNLLTTGLEGNLGWSIGPQEVFRAHALNPWVNLFD